MKKVFLVGLILFVLLIAGCVVPPDPEPLPEVIKFTSIENGVRSAITEKTHVVVNDAKAWDELYKKIHSDSDGIQAIPVIDFEKNTVIAVFMGEKPYPRYSLEVTKVLGSKKIVTVYANEIYKQLPKDTSDTPVTVSPYEIIRIPKTKLPVVVMRKQVNVLPDEPEPVDCAKEGAKFSKVYPDYPDECCPGLTEWNSGMDTRVSIAGQCYETGKVAGSPTGTCINCGNGVCDELEDACNCPKDCPEKSDYTTVDEFCDAEWHESLAEDCKDPLMQETAVVCYFCYFEPL